MLQLATAPAAPPAADLDPGTMATAAVASQSFVVDEFAGLARAYAESQAFVSLLAHELRSRLKVIEWSLLSEQGGGSSSALESTQSVQELVESLLELARGHDGDPTDAGEAVRRVIDGLGVRHVDVVVLGDLPLVALPQALLETVFRNLIVNAVEAGAHRIRVFARLDGTICVADDGPGIPAEKAEQIFGVYTSKVGGVGLGLRLCREILRRRGGDIWAELPSTFCFQVR